MSFLNQLPCLGYSRRTCWCGMVPGVRSRCASVTSGTPRNSLRENPSTASLARQSLLRLRLLTRALCLESLTSGNAGTLATLGTCSLTDWEELLGSSSGSQWTALLLRSPFLPSNSQLLPFRANPVLLGLGSQRPWGPASPHKTGISLLVFRILGFLSQPCHSP